MKYRNYLFSLAFIPMFNFPANAQQASSRSNVHEINPLLASNSQTLDVSDFGAIGDGLTDNAAAFSQAGAAASNLISSGKSVKVSIPAGTYRTSAPLLINADNEKGGFISVVGEGSSSIIAPTGDNSALDLEIRRGDVNFDISNLVASKISGQKGGEAIEVHSHTGPMGHGFLSEIVCQNLSKDRSKIPFHSCIHLRNVIRTEISHIKNLDNGVGNGDPSSGIGLWEDGTDGLYTVDNHVRDFQQNDGFAYIALTGHVEGLTVDALTGLGGAYGIYAPGRSWRMTPQGRDERRYPNNHSLWLSLTNSHVNSFIRGIYVVSANSIKVSNDLFYNTMLGSSQNIIKVYSDHSYLPLTTNTQGGQNTGGYSYIGIDLVNPSWSHVYANEIQSAGAQASTGLAVQKFNYDNQNEDSSNNFIYSNISMGSTAASMSFGNGIIKSFIYNNVADGPYYNGSSGNTYYNNKMNSNF